MILRSKFRRTAEEHGDDWMLSPEQASEVYRFFETGQPGQA